MESTYTVTMSIEGGQLGEEHEEITASDDDAAIEAARFTACEWVRDGDWDPSGALVTVDYEVWSGGLDESGHMIDQGSVEVEVEANHESLIRDAASAALYSDQIYQILDCEHEWSRDGEGGCSENPGVFSTGGTTIVTSEHCVNCGLHRTWTRHGSQRNPGESDTVKYRYEPNEEN